MRPHHLASIGGNKTVFRPSAGPNDFTNRGPRRFPTADLGGLIEDIRRNKLLDSFTMPRQRNNQDNINTWGTHQSKIQGGDMQANGVFQATSKGQHVYTLIQHKQERKYKIHKGRDDRHKTQNTAIQCSSNLWKSSCENIPHLILQRYWSRETRQRKIFQNMGET